MLEHDNAPLKAIHSLRETGAFLIQAPSWMPVAARYRLLRNPYEAMAPLNQSQSALIEIVNLSRRRALGQQGLDESIRGRLLGYVPSRDTGDGGARISSEGYFDGWSTPPWDSWVTFCKLTPPESTTGEFCLISLVPSSVFSLVERALEAAVDGSIFWLKGLSEPLSIALAAAPAGHLILD